MQQNTKLNTVLTILLVVLILFTLYISYYLATYQISDAPGQTFAQSYRGTLLMTLKPTEGNVGLYTFGLLSKSLVVKDEETTYYAPTYSTDDRMSYAILGENGTFDLAIANTINEDEPDLLSPPSPALSAGTSMWSKDDTAIVYDALTALPSEDDTEIENSRIIYVDTETFEQVVVDTGTSPLFKQDGSILYLKTDGVYYAEIVDMVPVNTERVIDFVDYEATTHSRVALSADEKLLAVTHPDSNLVSVYHLVTLGDGSRVPAVVFSDDTNAYWPVFSPDRQSIAYIQKTPAGKSISVYNVATGTSKPVFDLNGYDDDHVSLTAWTTK